MPAGTAASVHRDTNRPDGVARLTLENVSGRPLRVETASLAYLEGDRVLGAGAPGSPVPESGMGDLSLAVPAGGKLVWSGVCLDLPPERTDRVRFDLKLAARRGLRRIRTVESFEIPVRRAPAPVRLRLPFDGYWLVTQGHSCRTNHRQGGFGGDFAWDFVRFGPGGHSVTETYEATRRNRDSYSYGASLFAPADGRVVRAVDDIPDNEGLRDYPKHGYLEDRNRPDWVFGNFVVIDMGGQAYVLLAHLQRGSVSVRPGDLVRAGEPIARCGNSGNSIRPHLHLQVMDRADPADPAVSGLPASFADYREIAVSVRGGARDVVARRVPSGDPPESSVVTLPPAGE